jgi:hypothetical protein
MILWNKYFPYILLLTSFMVGWLFFGLVIRWGIHTDIQTHSRIVILFINQGSFPIPPLYYASIYLLSGLSTSVYTINKAAILVLSFALSMKFWATYQCAKYLDNNQNKRLILLSFISFTLLFIAPIFYDLTTRWFYLGRLGITIWHNSTTIAVMPFVVWLFYYSLKYLDDSDSTPQKYIFIILIMGIFNLLIKPSFLFAFIPIFPLMVLFREGFSTKFWISVSISIFLFSMILLQYYMIYHTQLMSVVYQNDQRGVGIALFKVWNMYSKNKVIDFLVSLLFPILCGLLFFKKSLYNVSIQYASLLFGFSLMLGILLVENGQRMAHGNFFWQIYMSNYLLFFVFSVFLFHQIRILGFRHYKIILLSFVWFLHLLSGVLYLFNMLYKKNFY